MPRSVSLSFELLQTLVSLIRHDGEASAVMQELELNQPTLSKRLRHLQHAGPLLDRPWLVREGKTWKLTAEGHKIWPAVEELVGRQQNLQKFIDEGGTPGAAAPVRFACGQQIAADLVRLAIREFRTKHPDARLRVSTLRGARESKAYPAARSTWPSSLMTSLRSWKSPAARCTSNCWRRFT